MKKLTKVDYQRLCEFLAKQPPMTVEITPLEIFFVIEVLLHGIAKVITVNRGVRDFIKKLIAVMNSRYPKIANTIVAVWISQFNLE